MDWIDFEEQLPPSGQYVLTYDKEGYCQVAVYMEPEKCWYDAIGVTHWMPLPPPPHKKEETLVINHSVKDETIIHAGPITFQI